MNDFSNLPPHHPHFEALARKERAQEFARILGVISRSVGALLPRAGERAAQEPKRRVLTAAG